VSKKIKVEEPYSNGVIIIWRKCNNTTKVQTKYGEPRLYGNGQTNQITKN